MRRDVAIFDCYARVINLLTAILYCRILAVDRC